MAPGHFQHAFCWYGCVPAEGHGGNPADGVGGNTPAEYFDQGAAFRQTSSKQAPAESIIKSRLKELPPPPWSTSPGKKPSMCVRVCFHMFPYVCSYYVSYVFHGQVCFTPTEVSYAEEPRVGLLLSALEEEDSYAEESCVLSDPRLAWRGFPWISPRQKAGRNQGETM